jgi:hypothetical protein
VSIRESFGMADLDALLCHDGLEHGPQVLLLDVNGEAVIPAG